MMKEKNRELWKKQYTTVSKLDVLHCIEFTREEELVEEFIALSHKLYHDSNNVQDDVDLRRLLCETHPLSKYFSLSKFLIKKNEEVLGRFAITIYPGDETAYLGFFECVNSLEIANFLFDNAKEFVKSLGFQRIIGPVDASFWLKYRLKTNFFDKAPYTGEPYNLDYYLDLFLKNGYEITERYSSSIYPALQNNYTNPKYSDRKESFLSKGYEIISPKMEHWDKTIAEIYELISDLYHDFPIYKEISREDFCAYFANYKKIIDLSMVKMAYYKERAVGFYISVPNYSNLVYHTQNPWNILKILKIKYFPRDYVMLYMGVLPEHRGLGKALVQSIIEELAKNGLPSIGALQKEGKITRDYVSELIQDRYEYVLLKLDI